MFFFHCLNLRMIWSSSIRNLGHQRARRQGISQLFKITRVRLLFGPSSGLVRNSKRGAIIKKVTFSRKSQCSLYIDWTSYALINWLFVLALVQIDFCDPLSLVLMSCSNNAIVFCIMSRTCGHNWKCLTIWANGEADNTLRNFA